MTNQTALQKVIARVKRLIANIVETTHPTGLLRWSEGKEIEDYNTVLDILREEQAAQLKDINEEYSGNTHELKCWPDAFKSVKHGIKSFEWRKHDRLFRVCDVLHLREWNPHTKKYSGDEVYVFVKFVLEGGQYGIPAGYCIMSIVPLPEPPQESEERDDENTCY